MTGEQNKKILILIAGVFGMIVGVFSVFIFQFIFAVQKEEPQVGLDKEPTVSKKEDSLFTDPFFNESSSFDSMGKMQREVLKGFESNFGDESFGNSVFSFPGRAVSNNYKLNQKEDHNNIIYEIELGSKVEGSSLNVSVENGVVKLSGVEKQTHKSESGSSQSYFSSSSSFSESFPVPPGVDDENVKITNEKNKIVLTFPKITKEN